MPKVTTLLFQHQSSTNNIEVWECDCERWLCINGIEQSRINTGDPSQLSSVLHHYFLAPLLFVDTPETILLGGLGGGSIARYLHYMTPNISGIAVEIDKTVTMVAKKYFSFPGKKWRIMIEDFNLWKGNKYDLIITDIADGQLTPDWLLTENNLSKLKSQLTNHGVLTLNLLVEDASSFKTTLLTIRNVFNRRVICLSVADYKNIIIIAFNRQPAERTRQDLCLHAKKLTEQWGIDYISILEQIKKDNPVGSGIF